MQRIKKYRSWFWVVFLVLTIHIVGNSLTRQLHIDSQASFSKIEQLNQSIHLAKQRKEELSRDIEAFQDPLWLEEVVKEELGLVRQKETKIVFRSH
jgi:hypothetical protein